MLDTTFEEWPLLTCFPHYKSNIFIKWSRIAHILGTLLDLKENLPNESAIILLHI